MDITTTSCQQCGREFTPTLDRAIWCGKCNDTFMQEALGWQHVKPLTKPEAETLKGLLGNGDCSFEAYYLGTVIRLTNKATVIVPNEYLIALDGNDWGL
jgi:hypothetical protein